MDREILVDAVWVNAECDVCKQVKPVATVKIFEFPTFEVSEIRV